MLFRSTVEAVDEMRVRLLSAPNSYVSLDLTQATGTAHSLRLAFNAATAVRPAGQAEIIDLGYVHGFQTGQAVVYSNGGGTSIGELDSKAVYYVIRYSETSIRLADSQAKALRGEYLDIDATKATGTGHSFGLPIREIGRAHV